jgi:hypothetical protein
MRLTVAGKICLQVWNSCAIKTVGIVAVFELSVEYLNIVLQTAMQPNQPNQPNQSI